MCDYQQPESKRDAVLKELGKKIGHLAVEKMRECNVTVDESKFVVEVFEETLALNVINKFV